MSNRSSRRYVVAVAIVFLIGCQAEDAPVIGIEALVLRAEEIPELKRSALEGDTEAATRLSNYYGFVLRDEEKQIQWLRVAADDGNTLSQTNLAILLLEKREPRASENAVQYLRMAADAGDATAQFTLGELYERGEGVAVDLSSARILYESSAKQGNYGAMVRLGEFALEGTGGPVDEVLGLIWLLEARRTVPGDTVLYDDLSEKIEQARKKMSDSQFEEAIRAAD